MRTPPRGLTLVEILVILTVLAVLAAIMIPNIIDSGGGHGRQTADTTNLKRLAESLLAGRADARAKRIPRSSGIRFWLALVVGDGPGEGNLEITGEDDADIYIGVGDAAGLLISPGDHDRMNKDELKSELEAVVEAGTGVPGLSDPEVMCNYAGPADPRVDCKNPDNPIIGCTRGGIFQNGFSAVSTSAEAGFYNYRDMADNFGWPDDTDTPLLGTAPLDHVTE